MKKKEIIKTLEEHPQMRDNLVGFLVDRNLKRGMTLEEAKMAAGSYLAMDSDSRLWRKVQQEDTNLRGNNWSKRQRKATEVRNSMSL
jgi:hypothetical protein